MQTLALTPLLRNSIGFDRFNDLFESAFRNSASSETPTFPPYNIEKRGDDAYRITMAVAGFKPQELEVVVHQNELTISGSTRKEESEQGVEYLHKGIATRSFQRKFSLADYTQVQGATIQDGLLQIDLKREIPEASKPRTITINAVEAQEVKRKPMK